MSHYSLNTNVFLIITCFPYTPPFAYNLPLDNVRNRLIPSRSFIKTSQASPFSWLFCFILLTAASPLTVYEKKPLRNVLFAKLIHYIRCFVRWVAFVFLLHAMYFNDAPFCLMRFSFFKCSFKFNKDFSPFPMDFLGTKLKGTDRRHSSS